MQRIPRRTIRGRLSRSGPAFFFLLFAISVSPGFAQDTPQPTKQSAQPPAKKQSRHTPKLPPGTFILVGAGDIAGCPDSSGAEATARLIDRIPGTVFAAGDLAAQPEARFCSWSGSCLLR